MVKRLFLILAMGAASSVSAQQLANGTFDAEWVNCYPWSSGKFESTARGTQPEGWNLSNVGGMNGLGATQVGTEGVGRDKTGKSVIVTNTPNPLSAQQVVPGYFSLGTAWATAKATITGSVTAGTADGGVFGGVAFKSRPDALHFFYKRAHNVNGTTKSPTNLDEKASIVAYTWKGTWTQADVPSNTAMGTPTKVTMTDRSNNILGKDCLTGGTIKKTDDAELISVIEYYIKGDQSDWKEMTIPFEYKSDKTPEKLNIIFAANDLFADRAGIGAGNQLTIDDVELIYYHALSSLSYDGKLVADFNEDKLSYDLSDVEYDSNKLKYTIKGVAAKASTTYNEETAKLTITVTGGDGEFTEYKIQFKAPSVLTSNTYSEILYVGVDGEMADPQTANVVVETLRNGNINFILKNFALGELGVGNIALNNLAVTDNAFWFNGVILIEDGDDESADMWIGPMLGEVPLDLNGFFANDKVYVTIAINMLETLGQVINVHYGYDMANMIVSSAKYGTFVAPFDVPIPSGVTASIVSETVASGLLKLEPIPMTIPANTPVVLYSEGEVSIPFFDVAVDGTPVRGLLTGVYTDTSISSGYVLQNNEGRVGFYKVMNGSITVPANRAYLNTTSNVKGFYFETATGIDRVESLEKKDEMYDLSGRRVKNATKGVYIVNGKKVLK